MRRPGPQSTRAAAMGLVVLLAACAPPTTSPRIVSPVGGTASVLPGSSLPQVVQPQIVQPAAVVSPSGRGTQTIDVRAAIAQNAAFPTAEATGTGAELAFVTDILAQAQLVSFQRNAEHCGYIGLDPQNRLIATPTVPGIEAACRLPPVPPDMRVLASFHTHSTYSPLYDSEYPTTQDLMTDAGDNIDGYISTPGGRLWYHDSDTLTVRQLCGRGCLPQDPNYVAADDGPIRDSYTLDTLRLREARGF